MVSRKREEAYYFSHDSNAHQDEKILELRAKWGWEGYGLYWGVVELMREQSNYRLTNSDSLSKKISLQLSVTEEVAKNFIDDCVDIGLFEMQNGSLYSESLLRRMAAKDKRSQRARKAANVRWNNEGNGDGEDEESDSNADAMRTHSDSKDSALPKKRKEKKRKEKDTTLDDGQPSSSESPEEKYNQYAPTTARGLDYDAIKEQWNKSVPEELSISQITDKRKRKLRKRYKEPEFSLSKIINAISDQPFLLGAGPNGWVVDFSWVIKSQENYAKILERAYKDRKVSKDEVQLQSLMEWAKEQDEKERREESDGEN